MKELLLKIASVFYGAAIKLRHMLFDVNILHSEKFDIPIICVGNITVGGTGKTPTVEMLVEHYSQSYNVAVLSRGYGRVTKGYRVVNTDDYYRNVGDEPLQIKRKFLEALQNAQAQQYAAYQSMVQMKKQGEKPAAKM
mgnify:CR=1 FL=1